MEDLIYREELFPTFSFLARKTNVNRAKMLMFFMQRFFIFNSSYWASFINISPIPPLISETGVLFLKGQYFPVISCSSI